MIQINSIYHDIQLSFGTSDVKRTTIKQNSEDTHVLRIKLYDKQNNEITIDSNWNINISAIKGDKTHILNTNNISVKDNTVYVTMTKQMLTASGTEHCELIIQDGEQVLFSDTFLIYVEPNVQDGSFIESSDEYDSIVDTLGYVQEKKDRVDQLTEEIEETKVDINNTYDELKIAVEETNDLIQENEIIKSNEAARVEAEKKRQEDTATAISNAEKATKSANDAATKANNATDDLQAKLDSHHFVLTEDKGSANGVAELDENGIIISSQLPSYVDDVIEGYFYNSKFYKESTHTTEITGETGKIYIDLSTEKTYRWSGSTFVVISETLALGETSSTAYRGDRGKTAYDHSQSAHAPSNAEENQNTFSSVIVGDDVISAISKTDVLNLVAGDNITLTPNADINKITISSSHESIATSTDTTSTASPSSGGTFTAVDSVTRDSNGHVTKVNTKTVTLPNTAVVVDSALSSTSTNPVQNKVVYSALNGKSDTGHTHTKSDVGLENVDNTSDSNKYVKYAESAGNALKLNLPREGTDANWLPDNGSTMQMRELHSTSSNLPEKNFFQIIACRSGDEGYGSQLALGMTTNNLYFRNYLNGEFNSWRKVAFTEGNDSLIADHLFAGDKVLMYTDSEGGNVAWTSAGNVKWEFDCLGEQFRLFNYLTFKDFKITQDGDVHCPKDLYTSSGIVSTSDKNKKHDIEEISDDFSEKIVDGLIPSSFKFDDGTSGRTHFGIIAQDLENLLEELGISTTDFAPLVKLYPDKKVKIENPHYDENDEHSEKYVTRLEQDYDAEPIYNVRYEEFIMILVKYCQCLKKKDLDLEKRMSELENRLNAFENILN